MLPHFNPQCMRLSGPYTYQVTGPNFTKLCQARPDRIALVVQCNAWDTTLLTPFVAQGGASLTPPDPELGIYIITYTSFPYLCSMEWYASTTPGPTNDVVVWEVLTR